MAKKTSRKSSKAKLSDPASSPPPSSASRSENEQKKPTPFQVAMREFIESLSSDEFEKDCKKTTSALISEWFQSADANVVNKYNHLVLMDASTLLRGDADDIYKAARNYDRDKPIMLTLESDGGSVASAYLISKLCREYSNGEFVVAVPRRAKSAATLICCGADRIHMGSLSELGPIDPQIDRLPALGLKNAVEHIAEMTKQFPSSSDMFAKYLQLSLDLNNLGYYERVAESAMQYANRLLGSRNTESTRPLQEISEQLVYEYKDHGFVIDHGEARTIFGDETIAVDSDEYIFSNNFYEFFDFLRAMIGSRKYAMYLIGQPGSEPNMYRKKSKQ